jgi:cell division septation protein DedD
MESSLDSTKEENKNVLIEVEDSPTNMETDQSPITNITADTTNENLDTIKQIEEIVDTVESTFQEEIEPSHTEPEKSGNTASIKKYHIIGGSFSSEKNASQFVKTLKENGYNKALIIGQRNELYTVSFGGYDSKDDAKEQADRIISDGKFQGAWVLYY